MGNGCHTAIVNEKVTRHNIYIGYEVVDGYSRICVINLENDHLAENSFVYKFVHRCKAKNFAG